MYQYLKERYKSDNILKTEWIMAAVIGAFIFFSFNYSDTKSLTIWSTNIWDVIYDGKFFDYYAYGAQNIHNLAHPYIGCDITAVLPWAIWNFPIWIVQRFAGIEIVETPWMMAWSKLFLVGVLTLTLNYTYKISMMLTDSHKKSMWAVFLSATSAFVYIGIFYAGQNDIIAVLFSVIAVYKLMQNKQWLFLLFSAISIAIKPFFLFPLIGIILLFEKDIIKAILKSFSTLGILLFVKLLFNNAPMYKVSLSYGPASEILNRIFASRISVGFGSVSFFAMALVIIYLFCYTRKFIDDLTRNKYIIYTIAVTYLIYFMLSFDSFYRHVFMIPFIFIMIIQNENIFRYNIILESLMAFCVTFDFALRGSPIFRTVDINYTWAQQLFGQVRVESEIQYNTLNVSIGRILNKLFTNIKVIDAIWPAISGIMFICALLLIILNFPGKKIKLPLDGTVCERWIIWLRMCIVLPFAVLALYCFFIIV